MKAISLLSLILGCTPTHSVEPVFHNSQEPRYAVLLVDAMFSVEDYAFDPETGNGIIYNLRQEIPYMIEVLDRANELDIPVFEITMGGSCSRGYESLCADNQTTDALAGHRKSQWVQIHKSSDDAFYQTNLQQELQKHHITDTLAIGFHQLVCLKATVESALALGYIVHTSFDVMQGTVDPYCTVTYKGRTYEDYGLACKPSADVEITYRESLLPQTYEFYSQNTVLAPTYRDLPIFY